MNIIQRRGNRLDSDVATCLELVGTAQDILFVGSLRENLLSALDARGCKVVCVLVGPGSAEEARVCRSVVESVSAAAAALPRASANARFDAVITEAPERSEDLSQLLAGVRKLLRDEGFVVVILGHIQHGAVRLAMINAPPDGFSGTIDSLNGYTAESMQDSFLQAGYHTERVEPLRRPLFESPGVLPCVERSQFHPTIVSQIEADPDATIYQFVAKIIPSDSDAQERVPTRLVSDSEPDRQSELEGKVAMHSELLSAIREVEKSAANLSQRLVQMPARRSQLESAMEERRRVADGLRAVAEDAQVRMRELTETLRLAQRAQAALRNELNAESAARLELQAVVDLGDEALAKANARTVCAEDDWFALYAELDDARRRADRSQATLAERTADFGRLERTISRERDEALEKARRARNGLASAQIALRENRSRTAELERKVREIMAQVLQGSEHAADLLRQLAQKEEQISEGSRYAWRLENELTEREALYRRAEAESQELSGSLAVLHREYEELQFAEQRAANSERLLQGELEAKTAAADQAMGRLAQLRAEHERVCRHAEELQARAAEVEHHYANAIAALEYARADVADAAEREGCLRRLTDEMRKSKFWRLRNGWFAIKGRFGVTTDIP